MSLTQPSIVQTNISFEEDSKISTPPSPKSDFDNDFQPDSESDFEKKKKERKTCAETI